ncbi:bacteriohemerythrin [Sideroxyarcus emersonii]|uniref:Bacteriohemerythrin n=1 Tax=Sideroxyarcus emersonii TaxID=2764705 RepID=A0AAN2BZ35_9PROT|nr:hemerythrin family protein [Sideroxyarcus emersonii]BCK87666.1 bacteriohemerythrin [Sideroxyarcus emersonii]
MSLVWRAQLSVGNNIIDSDHKYLIEIINKVEQALVKRNRNELSAALDSLTQYSRVHFDREEKIAAAVKYTQVPHLNQSHQELLKQLDQMKGEIAAMGPDWSAEATEHFTGFLRDWLINHVIKEDLLMKPVLQKYSPTFDPR